MPRVLFAAQPTITGVAQCVLDWTTGLQKRGWDVSLACPTDGWLGHRSAQAGIDVHRWDAVRQPHRGVLRELKQLAAIVEETQPDVVYLNGSKAGLVGRLLLRAEIPTVFSPHSWSYEASGGPVGWGALQWERRAARWTDRFACVSEAEAQDGRDHGIHGDYVIARNGVDTDQIRPLSGPQRQLLRRRLGLPQGRMCVVCVGRVHRQKGQDTLVEAWKRLGSPDADLVIVGDGPEFEATQALASHDVRFTGGVERDVALQWMQAADLLVMPSRWEGMALVPMESLAVGTPVIASDVTGVREAIDASCGEVFGVDDPHALSATLARWIPRVAADADTLRAAARARVVDGFQLSRTLDRIDATLRALTPEDLTGEPDVVIHLPQESRDRVEGRHGP